MIDLDLDFNFEFDDVETLTSGFSSCAVVLAIAEEVEIKSLKMTTLRVGKKEAIELKSLTFQALR